MPPPPTAQITLSFSRDTSIIAIAHGEQSPRAQTALETSGFQQRGDGTYVLPADNPEAALATVTDLIRAAKRHRTTVSTSNRDFLGDVAQDVAARLPGQWSAALEIYRHPQSQEDLVPWLWDAGDLSRAAQTARAPYAARLSDGEGIDLLLIERPGHHHGYVVGAFAPEGYDDNYDDPYAPSALIVPGAPEPAARAITERFLPAYHQALHARRANTVAVVLDRIRSEYDAWRTMAASGRYGDATPLGIDALGAKTEAFLDSAWDDFRSVIQHGPALLAQYPPGTTPRAQDTETLLARLAEALTDVEAVLEELACDTSLTRQELHTRIWPAIETWLTDGDRLLRQNHCPASHQQSGRPPSGPPGLPADRPAHRR